MKKNYNIDFILLNLEIITENVKTCIKKSAYISYLNEYKDTMYTLLDIIDSVDLIANELNKNLESELE